MIGTMVRVGVTVLFACVAILVLRVAWAFGRVRPEFRRELPGLVESVLASNSPAWVVGGMMGSGKTRFSYDLAHLLGAEHIEIDLYPSPEAVFAAVERSSRSWVAEANPWQVPPDVVSRANVTVFLDYDNVVNYARLLRRGVERWRSAGFTARAFRRFVVDESILDLGRIVFRYGRENRAGWRGNGLFGTVVRPDVVSVRCVSPRELRLFLAALEGVVAGTPEGVSGPRALASGADSW
jgi:hypothetical protein